MFMIRARTYVLVYGYMFTYYYTRSTRLNLKLKLTYYQPSSYAGVFIWIDLRCFLLDDPTIHNSPIDTSAYEDLKVTSPHSTKYLAREAKLANLAIDHKVLIARGSIYSTEEYGWFRITFTMEREALMEGLKRLWEVLEVIRVEGWGDADEGELKRGDVQRIQVQDGLTEEAGCL